LPCASALAIDFWVETDVFIGSFNWWLMINSVVKDDNELGSHLTIDINVARFPKLPVALYAATMTRVSQVAVMEFDAEAKVPSSLLNSNS
jgi:hypothetical protein